MNALHKIAGVHEADSSDPTQIPPVPQPTTIYRSAGASSQPLPIPPRDGRPSRDNTDARSDITSVSARRATLPLNHRRSLKSMQSGKTGRSEHIPSVPRIDKDALGPVPALPRNSLIAAHSQASLPRSALSNTDDAATAAAEEEEEEEEEEEQDEEQDEDFEWGPQHPCFPHPNPHCSPNSSESRLTRVIRVRRDWLIAGDLFPQYANLYPEILDPLVSDEEFRVLISDINKILQRTLSPYTWRAWFDSILGVSTGYLYDDLGFTGAKMGEKELEKYIKSWNSAREAEGREVKMIQLRRTGFMSLDFVIPDPGIDAPISTEDSDEGEEGLGLELLPDTSTID